MDKLYDMLRLHEGVRRFPYRCTAGKLTIGVGFNLDDVGLYAEEMDFILANRVRKLRVELYGRMPWVEDLDEVRQAVLLDMAYNLGVAGLVKFRKTLADVQAGRYDRAAREMLRSRWADQVGSRADRLSRMMESGQWDD